MDRSTPRLLSFGMARGLGMVAIASLLCAPRPAHAQAVIKVGTFNKSTCTAPCSQGLVAHGLGTTPSALILWTAGTTTTENNANANYRWGFGVTDGRTISATAGSRSVSTSSQFGNNSSTTTRRAAQKAITIVQYGSALQAEADLGGGSCSISWDETNFCLNWTTNNATAYIIHFIAIGGSGVQAQVVDWTTPASGNKAVTGLNFQPSVVLNFMDYDTTVGAAGSCTAPNCAVDSTFMLGAMDASGNQWANAYYATNGANPTTTARVQRTGNAATGASIEETNGTGTETLQAQYISMDANGFTVNFTKNTTGLAYHVFSLALTGVNFMVGKFDRLGNVGCPAPCLQPVSGLGFYPTAVFFSSFMTTGGNNPPTTSGYWGFGATDYTNQFLTSTSDENGVGGSLKTVVNYTERARAFDVVYGNCGCPFATGDLASGIGGSFDSDGFTLQWTTNSDNVATEITYLALGPLPGAKFIESGTDATQGFQFFSSTSGAVSSSTAVPADGPRSIKADSGGGNTAAWVQYNGSSKGNGGTGGRATAYFNFVAFPGATTSIMGHTTTSTTGRIDVRISSGGRLELWRMDATPVQLATGSTLSPNTWARIALTNDGTVNNWKVFLNGTQDISITNGTATVGSGSMFLGWGQAPGANLVMYIDDMYDDDDLGMTDPGDIRVTSKLPAAVNTNGFDTALGSGAVNERPLSETNGKEHAASTSVQQNYTLEAANIGDADISGLPLVARSAWVWAKSGNSSPITFPQAGHSANTTSVAITTPAVGDLILVFAYRSGSTTAPTLAAGYTSIDTNAPASSSNSARIGYKISDGTETTSGTWTNATQVVALIYRGVDPTTPIGATAKTSNNASAVITYPADTLQRTDGSSWVVGVAGARSATAGMNGAPTGTTNRTSQTTANGVDTNGGVTAWAAQTLNVTGSGNWLSWTIEIRGASSGARIMDNGTETPITLTTTSQLFTELTSSASYPSNTAGIGMRSSGTAADTFFYEAGTLIAFTPSVVTAATVTSLGATRYDKGVLVDWTTGYEVNNLGFHVYREINGQKTRVTQNVVAGSGLMAGQFNSVRDQRRYTIWDVSPDALNPAALYWLEDLDFNGTGTWHGPVSPVTATLQVPPDVPVSASLRDLNRNPKRRSKILRDEGTRIEPRWTKEKQTPATRTTTATSAAALADAEWAIAAQPAVKIGITHAGWYRVTQPELVAAGLNPGVDPRTLRLVAEGVEQAILVTGESDGRFDPSDAIEFYGTGLDTPYTAARIYWLVANGAAGKRVAVRPRPVKGADRTAPSFWYTVQQKERSIYFAALLNGDAENWFGSVISSDPIDETINAFHVDQAGTAGPADLEITVQGITVDPTLSLNHEIGVVVNGTEVGEFVFARQISATQHFSIPAAQLVDGANTIRLVARAGDADYSLVDVIRLSYWHTYQADADLLAASADGPGLVKFGGFAARDIRLVDITDPTAVDELPGVVETDAAGFAAISARVASNGSRILFGFTGATIARPAFVKRHQPSNWHAAGLTYDYVAITHANFASAADDLAAQRRVDGLTAAVIDVDAIYDEFSFGEKTPQAIKDFVQRARTSWKHAPKFLVLVGDATLDPRDYLGFGDADFVPSKQLPMAQVSLETASDDWYADADDDGVPEVAVGRLSVRTADQAFQMVDKIRGYASGDTGAWTKNVLLVADENDGVTNFARSTAALQALVPSSYVVHPVLRGQFGLDAARAELTTAINEGQLIVNYAGHGSVHVWGHDASLLTPDDIHTAWHNGSRLPLVVAMSCLNGFFHDIYDEESMAETLLRAPAGGAVAAWASSALTTPAAQATVNQELFRLIFSQPNLTIGEAVAAAKRVVADRDVRRSWIFFGDPAMRLSGMTPSAAPSTSSSPPPANVVAASSIAASTTPNATPAESFDPMPPTRLADWDGDHRADVFLYRGTNWRALLMASPNGRVQADTWDLAWDAYPADLNGDGASDLILYDRQSGQWAQAMNDGTANFRYTFGTWGRGWDVHVGDFTGDGKDDVVLTNSTTGEWLTALSDGKGHFTQRIGSWPMAPSTVVVGDFNGDGRADLFLYNSDTGASRVAYSEGLGAFTSIAISSGPGWTMRATNLNGDARADLLFYNVTTGQWSACVSGEAGSFGCRTGVWAAGLQVILLNAKDADDVLLYSPTTGAWTLLTTAANGTALAVTGVWAPALTIATGDLNADGRTDLLLYNPPTGAWSLGLAREADRFDHSSGQWNAGWNLALGE